MRIKPFHIIVILLTAATVAAYVAGIYLDRQVDTEQPSNVPRLSEIVNVHARDKAGRTPLMLAAKRGDVESVADLIARGADVNAKNNKGHQSLNYAAEKGHTEVVRMLLDNGADINAQSKKGSTALMLAVEGNHVDTAKLLIERGADITLKRWGYNALENAAGMGRPEIIRLLVEHGADVNEVNNKDDMRPLVLAARDGHLESVKVLVELGADVTFKDNGLTILDYVRNYGHEDVVRYLSAEVGLSRADEATKALVFACRSGDSAKALELIDGGAGIDTNIAYTPLMYAARSGDREFAKALLDRGANVNIRYYGDKSALDFAIDRGDAGTAMLLLDRGADVNKQLDHDKGITETTLMQAARKGLPGVVRKMVENGAEVNVCNESGWVALRCAVNSGSVETATVLLDNGADVKDVCGLLAWDTAAEKEMPEMLGLLLDYGGGHWIEGYAFNAAGSGDYDLLEKMLDRGVDANLRDASGNTLLDFAMRKGDTRLKELVVSHGALADPPAEDFDSFYAMFSVDEKFQFARTKFPLLSVDWQDCDGAPEGTDCDETIETHISSDDWGPLDFDPRYNLEEVFTYVPNEENFTEVVISSCVPETDNCAVFAFGLSDGLWYLVRVEG